jgi:hypothetical protein
MAAPIGPLLPEILIRRLQTSRQEAPTDVAVMLCTTDADGFPHPALLSYSDVRAEGPSALRIGVHARSTTATNLRSAGRLVLSFIDEAGAWYVKASVSGPEAPHPDRAGIVVFPLTIATVLTDAVDTSREPDAAIVSGVRFLRAHSSPQP